MLPTTHVLDAGCTVAPYSEHNRVASCVRIRIGNGLATYHYYLVYALPQFSPT